MGFVSDLFIVGIPFIKIIFFYFHLIIYSEFLLSITDIITIIFAFLILLFIIFNFLAIYSNDTNIFYCYNNTIVNGKIVKKNIKPNHFKPIVLRSIIFFIIYFFDYSNSIYIKFIPLYISIIISIIKYLFQREAIFQND
jgi:hypothetical protein